PGTMSVRRRDTQTDSGELDRYGAGAEDRRPRRTGGGAVGGLPSRQLVASLEPLFLLGQEQGPHPRPEADLVLSADQVALPLQAAGLGEVPLEVREGRMIAPG